MGLKILFVTPYFYPALAYGGPVKSTFDLARKLVARGNQVTVFTTDVLDQRRRIKSKKQSVDIKGIKVFYFPTISNWLSWHFKGFISPRMLPFLRKRAMGFDIIHIHDFYTFQTIVAQHSRACSGATDGLDS